MAPQSLTESQTRPSSPDAQRHAHCSECVIAVQYLTLQSSVALDLAHARPCRGGDFRVRCFSVPLFGSAVSAGCGCAVNRLCYCSYFSGPAFLAWHRMGNLQVGWEY
jgi:hypothetical protein